MRKKKAICSVADCQREIGKGGAKGMCPMHYSRWKRTGSPGELEPRIASPHQHKHCIVGGCSAAPPYTGGYCQKHYTRVLRHGDAMKVCSRRKPVIPCTVAGCQREIRAGGARGLCAMHYSRWKRSGELGPIKATRLWRPPWTREQTLEAFRHWAREHGRPPGCNDWQTNGGASSWAECDHPTTAVVYRIFGSWVAGIEAAGLTLLGAPTTPSGGGHRRGKNRQMVTGGAGIASSSRHDRSEHGTRRLWG